MVRYLVFLSPVETLGKMAGILDTLETPGKVGGILDTCGGEWYQSNIQRFMIYYIDTCVVIAQECREPSLADRQAPL